jgi:hypothetical protein
MAINETAIGNDSVAITGTASAGERTLGIVGQGDSVGVKGVGKDWNGVEGISQSTIGGAGVFGANDTGAGVRGESKARFNPGVHGIHRGLEGPGVQGDAENGAGIVGISKTWLGVYGETNAPANAGAAGVLGEGKDGGDGVKGHATAQGKAGVAGFHLTNRGPGIFGKGSPAGRFEGNVEITGKLTIEGGIPLDIWLQKIVRLEQEVISLRHQLATHTHTSGGSVGGTQAVATIHVQIDLTGFSQSFATRRVTGGGFNANEAIVIKTTSAGVTEESSASAGPDGTYQQELSVPRTSPPKQYEVLAQGTSSGRVTNKAGYSV